VHVFERWRVRCTAECPLPFNDAPLRCNDTCMRWYVRRIPQRSWPTLCWYVNRHDPHQGKLHGEAAGQEKTQLSNLLHVNRRRKACGSCRSKRTTPTHHEGTGPSATGRAPACLPRVGGSSTVRIARVAAGRVGQVPQLVQVSSPIRQKGLRTNARTPTLGARQRQAHPYADRNANCCAHICVHPATRTHARSHTFSVARTYAHPRAGAHSALRKVCSAPAINASGLTTCAIIPAVLSERLRRRPFDIYWAGMPGSPGRHMGYIEPLTGTAIDRPHAPANARRRAWASLL
jgi:hypothetical protein